jgi:hypothetical protein
MLLASGQKNCDKLVIVNKHIVGSTELTIVLAIHTP